MKYSPIARSANVAVPSAATVSVLTGAIFLAAIYRGRFARRFFSA